MEHNRQEDLDMLSLVESLKKGIVSFFKGIAWLINFSIKKFSTIFIFILIGGGISTGLYMMAKPYYKSELMVNHIRFDNDFCYAMVHNLNSYLDDKSENKLLATQLGIDVQYAKEVRNISYKPANLNISKRYEDSAHVILPFIIEVEIYNNNALDTLQKGILNYLESNQYVTKRKEIDRNNLSKISERVENEISEIDSLKKLVNLGVLPRSTGNGIVFGEPIDPVRIYYRGLEMYEKKLTIDKTMLLNNSFEILVGFSKNAKRSSSGKLFYLFFGILSGYLIGLIFAISRESVRNRKNETPQSN